MPHKDKEERKAYAKEYRAKNKERIRAEQKEYNDKNRERRKEYYQKNKERIDAKEKEYRAKNKEKRKAYEKEYYAKNKEKYKAYGKQYKAKNKDKSRIKHWKYQGIIDGDFPLLNEVFEQQTHCWICGVEYSKTRIKCLDHDWEITDDSNPRYICCHYCNINVVG